MRANMLCASASGFATARTATTSSSAPTPRCWATTIPAAPISARAEAARRLPDGARRRPPLGPRRSRLSSPVLDETGCRRSRLPGPRLATSSPRNPPTRRLTHSRTELAPSSTWRAALPTSWASARLRRLPWLPPLPSWVVPTPWRRPRHPADRDMFRSDWLISRADNDRPSRPGTRPWTAISASSVALAPAGRRSSRTLVTGLAQRHARRPARPGAREHPGGAHRPGVAPPRRIRRRPHPTLLRRMVVSASSRRSSPARLGARPGLAILVIDGWEAVEEAVSDAAALRR